MEGKGGRRDVQRTAEGQGKGTLRSRERGKLSHMGADRSSGPLSAPSPSRDTAIPSTIWELLAGFSNPNAGAAPSEAVHSPGRCRLDACSERNGVRVRNGAGTRWPLGNVV